MTLQKKVLVTRLSSQKENPSEGMDESLPSDSWRISGLGSSWASDLQDLFFKFFLKVIVDLGWA